MKEIQEKALVGAVIFNQLALMYNEALVGTPFYQNNLKNKLDKAIKQLRQIEIHQFDLVVNEDEDNTEYLTDRIITMLESYVGADTKKFIDLGEISIAYDRDQKSIMGIVKKISKKKLASDIM